MATQLRALDRGARAGAVHGGACSLKMPTETGGVNGASVQSRKRPLQDAPLLSCEAAGLHHRLRPFRSRHCRCLLRCCCQPVLLWSGGRGPSHGTPQSPVWPPWLHSPVGVLHLSTLRRRVDDNLDKLTHVTCSPLRRHCHCHGVLALLHLPLPLLLAPRAAQASISMSLQRFVSTGLHMLTGVTGGD